jgi:hypothetical protein
MIHEALKKLVEGKEIAIVGNAKSLFKKPRPIDDHEVVIRINRGSPKGKEDIIGSRTDILALSLPLEKDEIITDFNPRMIVWCTPRYTLMNKYLQEVALVYPQQYWRMLRDTLGARPSTGCMIASYLAPYAKHVTLYGFDFWKSENWYTQVRHLGEHDPDQERLFMNFLLRKGKGTIVK